MTEKMRVTMTEEMRERFREWLSLPRPAPSFWLPRL